MSEYKMMMQHNVDLKPFNTMGFSALSHHYISVQSADDIACFLTENANATCFVLGGGSNLVLTRDIECVVLHMQNKGVCVYEETDSHVLVGVQAGEVWHEWVMTSIHNGWMGLENLALIPGTVGASPVQNIGAYGVEVQDCIVKIKAWDCVASDWVWLQHEDCAFAYRDSIFKQQMMGDGVTPRYIIVEVCFDLLKDASKWQPKMTYGDVAQRAMDLKGAQNLNCTHVAQAIIDIRSSKLPDPLLLGNAGSFFKNPIVGSAVAMDLKRLFPSAPTYVQDDGGVKLAAGWLIEQAGLKGYRDGCVGVYDKQALVLVHFGGGSGHDLMALAHHIVASVFDKFGIKLVPEPIVY